MGRNNRKKDKKWVPSCEPCRRHERHEHHDDWTPHCDNRYDRCRRGPCEVVGCNTCVELWGYENCGNVWNYGAPCAPRCVAPCAPRCEVPCAPRCVAPCAPVYVAPRVQQCGWSPIAESLSYPVGTGCNVGCGVGYGYGVGYGGGCNVGGCRL